MPQPPYEARRPRSSRGSIPSQVDGRIDIWEKVVRKLRTGMMPPDAAPKPSPAARDAFTSALEAQLDRAAALHPDPGATALHRLNRAEYANAIRDLLALDVDVSGMLPPDDSAAGFDNNADVLGVSPALIEGYASAAAKVSRLAVGDPSIGLDRVDLPRAWRSRRKTFISTAFRSAHAAAW